MRILAADDEPLALRLLSQAIVTACPQAQLSCFSKAGDVLEHLKDHACDVAFLDIRMRGMDGLTLAQRIRALQPRCNLIFVTGHSAYATDALQLHASGYILKPVTAEKIRAELADLRHPVQGRQPLLRLRCFSNFEAFSADGSPIRFPRSKSKEALAYLVYRQGSSCSVRELAAVLFEDREYDRQQMSYLQKILSSLIQTLRGCGAEAVIQKTYNAISLNTQLVDCDYYRFLEQDPAARSSYSGEFMAQYSWAEFMAGYLDRQISPSPEATQSSGD